MVSSAFVLGSARLIIARVALTAILCRLGAHLNQRHEGVNALVQELQEAINNYSSTVNA